jgi:hypothetical protein
MIATIYQIICKSTKSVKHSCRFPFLFGQNNDAMKNVFERSLVISVQRLRASLVFFDWL